MTITRHQATGAYQRWQPPAFDAEEPEEAPQDTAEPRTLAHAPPEPAAPEPHVQLPTADEIEGMFEQARHDGEKAGYDEGRKRAAAEETRARNEATRLAQLVKSMDSALDQLGGEVAGEIVELAIALARQMVGDTLTARPEAVAATVREALQHVPQGKVRIHLHPDDIKLVRQHLDDQLEAGHHHLIEDTALKRGGCRLETAGSDIDATIETRWERVLIGIGRGQETGAEDE